MIIIVKIFLSKFSNVDCLLPYWRSCEFGSAVLNFIGYKQANYLLYGYYRFLKLNVELYFRRMEYSGFNFKGWSPTFLILTADMEEVFINSFLRVFIFFTAISQIFKFRNYNNTYLTVSPFTMLITRRFL